MQRTGLDTKNLHLEKIVISDQTVHQHADTRNRQIKQGITKQIRHPQTISQYAQVVVKITLEVSADSSMQTVSSV